VGWEELLLGVVGRLASVILRLRQQARFRHPRNGIQLQDERPSSVVQPEVHAGSATAPQATMHLQRESLKLLGQPARELGGSLVMAGARRVLGPEIVKAALRYDLHDRQRTVVQDCDREFPT